MNTYMIVAAVLILLGILGLVYGQFTYTKDSDAIKLGPLEMTVKEKETVNIPVWLGAGSIVSGAALLIFAVSKKQPS